MPIGRTVPQEMQRLLDAIIELTEDLALDTEEARLREAAKSGIADDLGRLGTYLIDAGQHDEAETLLGRAADQGDAAAMFHVGVLRRMQDKPTEALPWLHRAVDTGYEGAALCLGSTYHLLDMRSEAERWFKVAAEAGDAEGMYSVGLMALRDGRARDAERWFRMAAEERRVNAMFDLGVLMYKAGRLAEAERWYHKAADGGRAEAMNNLGQVLWGSARFEDAEQWFRRAAEKDITQGMYNLSTALKRQGRHEEAAMWLQGAQRQEVLADEYDPEYVSITETETGPGRTRETSRIAICRGGIEDTSTLNQLSLAGVRTRLSPKSGPGMPDDGADEAWEGLGFQSPAADLEASGDSGREAVALIDRGVGYLREKQPDEAVATLRHALELARRIGARRMETSALYNLGIALKDAESYDEAVAVSRESIDISRELDAPEIRIGEMFTNLAESLLKLGRHDEAAAAAKDAVPILDQHGDTQLHASTLVILAEALAAGDRKDEAIQAYSDAARVHRDAHEPVAEGVTLIELSDYLNQLGSRYDNFDRYLNGLPRYDSIMACSYRVIEIFENTPHRDYERIALTNLAGAHLGYQEYERCIEAAQRAFRSAIEDEDVRTESLARIQIGAALVDSGRIEEGITYNEACARRFRELGDRKLEALALKFIRNAHNR